jgi:hypothetical protein
VENCPVSMVLWLSSSCEFMIVFCFVLFSLFCFRLSMSSDMFIFSGTSGWVQVSRSLKFFGRDSAICILSNGTYG